MTISCHSSSSHLIPWCTHWVVSLECRCIFCKFQCSNALACGTILTSSNLQCKQVAVHQTSSPEGWLRTYSNLSTREQERRRSRRYVQMVLHLLLVPTWSRTEAEDTVVVAMQGQCNLCVLIISWYAILYMGRPHEYPQVWNISVLWSSYCCCTAVL